jgi:predicted kinase
VLRGNSGAGKSTVARMVRSRLTGCVAWVEQDYFRRVVLHEHDIPDGLNIGLSSQTVRYALDHGCDVILAAPASGYSSNGHDISTRSDPA